MPALDPILELAIAMQQLPERPVRDHLVVWSGDRQIRGAHETA